MSHRRRIVCTLVVVLAVFASTSPAGAVDGCKRDRFQAADRFVQCRHKAMKPNDIEKVWRGLGKCLTKYLASWAKIQARAGVSSDVCGQSPRFVDGGDGTVTDNLTGLQWEKKTDDGGIHDKDDLYAWSATGTAADGAAFTTFLATLNLGGACFAGQCDWRLPTPAELTSIQLDAFPNCSVPCVDASLFGPVPAFPLWSGLAADDPANAWNVTTVGAEVSNSAKTVHYAVRAVRGGL